MASKLFLIKQFAFVEQKIRIYIISLLLPFNCANKMRIFRWIFKMKATDLKWKVYFRFTLSILFLRCDARFWQESCFPKSVCFLNIQSKIYLEFIYNWPRDVSKSPSMQYYNVRNVYLCIFKRHVCFSIGFLTFFLSP